MSPPRFSIIIPCFNQGTFLEENLATVRAQTLAPHEIIVVDDGSTDEFTVKRIDELCTPPVILIRQPNGGLPAARNAGVRRSTGDWLIPLDADDQLAPNALQCYADSIARERKVDIWYPDIRHFGLDGSLFESPEFDRWRLLWSNHLVCSSAIHRRVFDAGVLYNERMRNGYEDWEFFIHACCEAGFVARALRAPVFRYRRWGFSMLAASNLRAAELLAQIKAERPIYQDQQQLLAFKRESCPCFAIAAEGPELSAALDGQAFRDFRIVDQSGRVVEDGDLSVFRGGAGRALLVSLDDAALSAAFRADPFLLEKLARSTAAHDPALTWLVSSRDQGGAYAGQLLPTAGQEAPEGRCLGFVVSLELFFAHPEVPKNGVGFIGDLSRFTQARAPGRIRYFIVGAQRDADEGVELPREEEHPAAERPRAVVMGPLRERFSFLGQGVSRFTRGVIGPDKHDRLWQHPLMIKLRDAVESGRPGPGGPLHHAPTSEVRVGPLDPRLCKRDRDRLWEIAHENPQFAQPPTAQRPGILIAVSWIILGGVDRAVIDLVKSLKRLVPDVPLYLVMTESAKMAWANQLLPHLSGVFSLPAMAEDDGRTAMAQLTERLNVGALLIANSKVAYDALPLIRKSRSNLRVVSQLHGFDRDPKTGRPTGHPVYAASRFDNLIDCYAPISDGVSARLIDEFYVSPSKVRTVRLGIDVPWFANARRERFAGNRATVLWLGRVSDEKDPLLALEVAAAWKQRHGVQSLQFVLAGSGPLDAEVRAQWKKLGLEDLVSLVGSTPDPLPLYLSADCLMLTSRYEGIPVVIYEAMAAGLPVLTPTRNTSIGEVLTAEEAYFVDDSRDPEAYLRWLEHMLQHPQDARTRAARMIEKSERVGLDRYAAEMLQLLRSEKN